MNAGNLRGKREVNRLSLPPGKDQEIQKSFEANYDAAMEHVAR